MASTDSAIITSLWTDPVLKTERNWNIGCACNDMVVIDIDVKNGKKGTEEYAKLGGHYDTLVVRTTSGGYHCYFYGPDSSNAPLAAGVDVRSHNGYVVAPGSTIDGRPYEVINDRELAWVPLSVEPLLQPVYVRPEEALTDTRDSEASVSAAIRYLQSAPPAIEGARGDDTTFVVACRLVREMALSPTTAYTLLAEHYNPRCSPPWELEDLWNKVQNASSYGTAAIGLLTPEVAFAHVKVSPPPNLISQAVDWGNAYLPTELTPRPWLVDRMLVLRAVTMLIATGSAGKSTLALALAAHMAIGREFAGHKVHYPCKTIVYNGEDDREEQSRRLYAICVAYELDYHKVKKQIMLVSNRDIKLQLVVKADGGKAAENTAVVKHLVDLASDSDVGCIILDPLVKIHQCEETNNTEMDVVMETLTNIAHAANVSVMAIHHTSKGNEKQADRVGNADSARGASAIINASRIAFTLYTASQQDCLDYGIPEDENYKWVRLDDAKMNLTLATNSATWFSREGLKIPSGDIVGVVKYERLEKSKEHIKIRIAKVLIQAIRDSAGGSIPMAKALSLVKADVPLWKNKTDVAIRRELEGMFATPLSIGDESIQVKRDGSGDNSLKFTF